MEERFLFTNTAKDTAAASSTMLMPAATMGIVSVPLLVLPGTTGVGEGYVPFTSSPAGGKALARVAVRVAVNCGLAEDGSDVIALLVVVVVVVDPVTLGAAGGMPVLVSLVAVVATLAAAAVPAASSVAPVATVSVVIAATV